MKLASQIIALRTKAGFTRYALSQACGVPQSQLADYEVGQRQKLQPYSKSPMP